MAVPRIVAQQGLQVAPAGARLSASDLGAGFGAALVNLGDNAAQLAVRQAQLNDQAARAQRLGDLRVQAMSDLAALRGKYANDRDPGTMAQRWGTDADALLDGYKQKAGEDPIWGAFEQDFKQLRIRDQVDVQTDAAKGLAVRGQAGLESNIDTLGTMLGQSNDPVRSGQIKDMAAAAVGDAVNHGYIDEIEAGKMLRKFVSKGDEARARVLVTTDAELAEKTLADPKAFPDLDEVKRAQLLDMATRRVDSLRSDRIAAAALADRAADKQLTKDGEAAAKRIDALMADGTLTRDTLDSLRETLPKSDYKDALAWLNNPDAARANNPVAIEELEDKLGKPDFAAANREAFRRHDITEATYRSYNTQNRTMLNADAPELPKKAGKDLIRQTLDPSGLLSGDEGQIAKVGMANALNEYEAWAEAHPQATRAEANAEAQATIARYQVLNYQKMELATGLPKYATGVTKSTLKPADLDAAEDATLQALDRKELTPAQAQQELRKIQSWRGILQSKPPAQSKGSAP